MVVGLICDVFDEEITRGQDAIIVRFASNLNFVGVTQSQRNADCEFYHLWKAIQQSGDGQVTRNDANRMQVCVLVFYDFQGGPQATFTAEIRISAFPACDLFFQDRLSFCRLPRLEEFKNVLVL